MTDLLRCPEISYLPEQAIGTCRLNERSCFKETHPGAICGYYDNWLRECQAEFDREHQAKEALRQEKSQEMKRRRARGKYTERKVAKDVGGRVDGRAGKKDVVKGMFYFETKSHKKTPKYLRGIMDEAIRHCTRDKIPVGVIYDRERNEYYYIMMRGPWLDLHGKTK